MPVRDSDITARTIRGRSNPPRQLHPLGAGPGSAATSSPPTSECSATSSAEDSFTACTYRLIAASAAFAPGTAGLGPPTGGDTCRATRPQALLPATDRPQCRCHRGRDSDPSLHRKAFPHGTASLSPGSMPKRSAMPSQILRYPPWRSDSVWRRRATGRWVDERPMPYHQLSSG